MEWLSQNWIWLAFGVGMVMMMRRGGAGGCCGGGHGNHDKPDQIAGVKGSGGAGCCGGDGHGAADGKAQAESAQPQSAPAGAAHHH